MWRLVLVLVLLGGCATNHSVQFEEQNTEFKMVVSTYADKAEVNEAHCIEHPHHCHQTVSGFVTRWGSVCHIHVVAMTDVDVFWLHAGNWGHELAHCVYENFHEGVYRGHP